MKKKQKITVTVVVLIAVVIAATFYQFSLPKDRCTSRDREINDCMPAGKCSANSELDSVIDCDVKNYDKKINSKL